MAKGTDVLEFIKNYKKYNDQPQPDNRPKPGDVWIDAAEGAQATPHRFVVDNRDVLTDERAREAANNASPRLLLSNINVTIEQFNDFKNKEDPFKDMVDKWAAEDDPKKRAEILKDYDKRFKFSGNPIFDKWGESLGHYDYGEANDFSEGVDRNQFSPEARRQWRNYVFGALGDAHAVFNRERIV